MKGAFTLPDNHQRQTSLETRTALTNSDRLSSGINGWPKLGEADQRREWLNLGPARRQLHRSENVCGFRVISPHAGAIGRMHDQISIRPRSARTVSLLGLVGFVGRDPVERDESLVAPLLGEGDIAEAAPDVLVGVVEHDDLESAAGRRGLLA